MKKSFCGLIVVMIVFGFASTGVMAKSEITPGGPWLTDNQTVNYNSLSDYEELVKRLKQTEKSSKGLVQLESIGLTNQGRDIWMAKVGNPTLQPVMIITQQHGNEPIGTESALQLIKNLSTGSAKAQKILDQLYVLIVVRVNPDGAELWQRYNYIQPHLVAGLHATFIPVRELVGISTATIFQTGRIPRFMAGT